MKCKMAVFSLVLALALLLSVGAAAAQEEKPIVVCTTTVLGSIVEQLAGDQVEVVVFVQPGICPAFYDVKPGDLYSLEKASIVFYHGFEYKMWLKGMLENTGSKAVTVQVKGNWNTPEGAKSYITTIAKALEEELDLDVSGKAQELVSEIDEAASEIRAEAESLGVSKVNVICMQWQKPFVSWVGFNVVDTYGPPERLPAGKAAELAAKAKSEDVKLVIDNLQSGTAFGASLAEEVGAIHVVLTNFPGAIPGTDSLADLMKYNARQLFDAVKKVEYTEELREEIGTLKTQLTITLTAAIVLAAVAAVEGAALYAARKRR
ncbi:MAG: metal ABC transporter substrate-binding protein [Candidatus Hecatellaceae archaeon]